jgi:hypothetical protein
MADIPPSSRPPADPRLPPRPADATGQIGAYERPARWQTIAAAVLGVVLFAVPLYLWRRPRSVAEPVVRDDAADVPAADLADVAAPDDEAGARALSLGDPRILECRDPGSRATPAERCDHLPPFERGFAQAILDAHDCVPAGPAGGTITYVADVAFTRKRAPVLISAPKDGRSVKSYKVVEACVAAVRRGLSAVSIDGLAHAHARYKVAVSATYPAAPK